MKKYLFLIIALIVIPIITSANSDVGGSEATCTLSASPTTITLGQAATLSWTSSNAALPQITQNIGTVAPTGSLSVSPTVTSNYALILRDVENGAVKYRCRTRVNVIVPQNTTESTTPTTPTTPITPITPVLPIPPVIPVTPVVVSTTSIQTPVVATPRNCVYLGTTYQHRQSRIETIRQGRDVTNTTLYCNDGIWSNRLPLLNLVTPSITPSTSTNPITPVTPITVITSTNTPVVPVSPVVVVTAANSCTFSGVTYVHRQSRTNTVRQGRDSVTTIVYCNNGTWGSSLPSLPVVTPVITPVNNLVSSNNLNIDSSGLLPTITSPRLRLLSQDGTTLIVSTELPNPYPKSNCTPAEYATIQGQRANTDPSFTIYGPNNTQIFRSGALIDNPCHTHGFGKIFTQNYLRFVVNKAASWYGWSTTNLPLQLVLRDSRGVAATTTINTRDTVRPTNNEVTPAVYGLAASGREALLGISYKVEGSTKFWEDLGVVASINWGDGTATQTIHMTPSFDLAYLTGVAPDMRLVTHTYNNYGTYQPVVEFHAVSYDPRYLLMKTLIGPTFNLRATNSQINQPNGSESRDIGGNSSGSTGGTTGSGSGSNNNNGGPLGGWNGCGGQGGGC